MAVDIIIRPEAKCLTLAFDTDMPAITAIRISGSEVRAEFADGEYMEFGPLADSMRLDARACSIGVVVRMDGDRVAYSHKVEFVSD